MVNDYLLKIKSLVDQLTSVGDVLATKDHIDAIIYGLSSEYDTFVVLVNSRNDSYIVAEIESMLLAQESRIEKHFKELDLSNQVNMVKIFNNQLSHKKFNGKDKVVFNAILLDQVIKDLKISILLQVDKIKEMEEVVGNNGSHNASCVVKLGM